MLASSSPQNPKKNSSTMEPLNLDMMMEILSRSSLQTISKCRLLSKEFNSLTYESFFRDLLSRRTKIVSGLFMQFLDHSRFYSQFVTTNEQSVLSLDFLPCPVQIKASTSTGILLCVNVTPRIPQYYVCKPSTKQYRQLPNPKTRYFTLATGMVVVKSNPLHYKIVRISQPKLSRYHNSDCCNYRTQIFDSETWSWKQVNDVSFPFGKFLVWTPAISAGGSLYWSVTDNKSILAYHQEDNCCTTFSLPEEVQQNHNIRLIEYEGRLGVLCDKGGLLQLWMMKNNDEKLWFKRLSVNCEDVRKQDSLATCLTYYGSDVALFRGVYQFIFYNLNKKNTDVVKVDRFINVEDVFQFQSDYELVNFYHGRR